MSEQRAGEKKSEKHLGAQLESPQINRELVAGLSGAFVFHHDTEGMFTHVTSSVTRVLGYTPAEFLGHFSEILTDHPQNRVVTESTASSLRGEQLPPYQAQVFHKDGSVRWLEISEMPVCDEHGAVVVVEGIALDITARRRAEQESTDARHYSENLIDTANAMIIGLGVDGSIQVFNPAAERITGYTLAELEGKSWFDTLAPSNLSPGVREEFERLMAGGETRLFENPLLTKDGQERFIAWSNSKVTRQGEVVGTISFGIDLTERKQARDALRAVVAGTSSEVGQRFFDKLVGHLAEALGFRYAFIAEGADRDLTRVRTLAVWANGHIADNFEYGLDGTPCFDVLQEGTCLFERDVATLFPRDTLLAQMGVQSYLGTPLCVQGDRPLGILVVMDDHPLSDTLMLRDIVEIFAQRATAELIRLRAEKAHRESEARYRAMFERNLSMQLLIDPTDGRILDANPAAIAFYGYSRERLTGMTITDITTLDGAEARAEMDKAAGEERGQFFFRHQLASGEERDVEVHSSPIEVRGKTILYSIVHDVTKRRRLERQLHQAQKMEAMGTLAGGIAHDFNNILSAIVGNADLLLDDMKSEKMPEVAGVEEILMASDRARELVRQILAFSRKSERTRRPVRVTEVSRETLGLLRSAFPTSIEIRKDINCRGDMVMADPIQLHQVVMNLCTNAAHSMHDHGGVLTLSVKRVEVDVDVDVDGGGDTAQIELAPGPYVELSVSDTGLGIDALDLPRIFDPFFTTKDPGEGTGMGLAVAHGIVTGHRGEITVQSELGVGTTFCVLLPSLEAADHEREIEETALPRGSERVLVVEDEPVLRELLNRLLRSLGYRTEACDSGDAAWELFGAEPLGFDLVLTDLTMPGISGLELASRILELRPEFPIILSTGFSDSLTRKNVRDLGISELVAKPLRRNDLAAVVRRVLDEA